MIADCSTIAPVRQPRYPRRELSERCEFPGCALHRVQCPEPTNGTLTFMIGGDQAVFEKRGRSSRSWARCSYYCGGPGMGLHAKLTQNLVLANVMMAFNEGMVLAAKGGVDPGAHVGRAEQQRGEERSDCLQSPVCPRRNFTTNFSVKMDA